MFQKKIPELKDPQVDLKQVEFRKSQLEEHAFSPRLNQNKRSRQRNGIQFHNTVASTVTQSSQNQLAFNYRPIK